MELKHAITAVFAILTTLGASRHAAAENPAGAYTVKVQEISSSCTDAGMKLDKGTLVITTRGDEIEVRLAALPAMTGKARKGGKLKVASSRSPVADAGADAALSAAGHVEGGRVQIVLVAEYYRSGKALCTQSWDVSGARR